MSKQKISYSFKRIAAALRKVDHDLLAEEFQRFDYVFDKENHMTDHNLRILCFYPAGISCQIDGVTHYTPRSVNKPKADRYHNLKKANER